jgi:hypothetical protein
MGGGRGEKEKPRFQAIACAAVTDDETLPEGEKKARAFAKQATVCCEKLLLVMARHLLSG